MSCCLLDINSCQNLLLKIFKPEHNAMRVSGLSMVLVQLLCILSATYQLNESLLWI